MNPHFPPILEIAAVFMAELLFGFGYNTWVAWAQEKGLWHVSTSVIVGVVGTFSIYTGAWWNNQFSGWQATLLLLGCFSFSGVPMVIGSMHRSAESHKRRPWPTSARHAREDALFELHGLAGQIETAANKNEITPGFLPTITNRIYYVIGTLKSVP